MAYIAPSTPEQKVQAGYLALCSTQAAYDWLRDRAPKDSVQSREALSLSADRPDLEEFVLLRRAEPLIDLGLARFGRTERAVRRVYRRGGAACRLAAWSNTGARGSMMTRIWADRHDLARLAEHGTTDELLAMSANPVLHDTVLSALLTRKEHFASLTQDRWITCLTGLMKNPRMEEEYGDDRPMNGYADYQHHKVFTDAWTLAATLPADQFWAGVLERLLRNCHLPVGMRDGAEALLERWRIDVERKLEDRYWCPGSSFYLRARLADLLKVDSVLLGSEDRALRLSFWKRFEPVQLPSWPAAMEHVFDQETETEAHEALSNAMRNPRLWWSGANREALHELSWKAPDRSKDMQMPNLFRDFERRNRQRFPEWFQDAQPGHGPGDEETPWVTELAARLDRLEVAAPVVVQAPAPRPWWSGIPWWVWLVAGFVAARLVPMPH